MKTGIIGARGAGKSTVFHALTGLAQVAGTVDGKNRARPGQIKVADPRLDFLESAYGSKKKVPVELTIIDFAPNLASLAHHYGRSANAMKAAEYLRRAAEQSMERSAYAAAAAWIDDGLRQIGAIAQGAERNRLELRLQISSWTRLVCRWPS